MHYQTILTAINSYDNCPSGYYYNNGRCSSSNWNYWGRWVLAAVVIVFFIIVFFFWSCLGNRRRRRRGVQPIYGTGWMTPGQQPQYGNGWFGHGQQAKNNVPPQQPLQQQPPPPQYTPRPMDSQYTGQTYDTNEGYYGHHNNDIPLQQPTSAYYPRGGDNVYEPPAGPPPTKR